MPSKSLGGLPVPEPPPPPLYEGGGALPLKMRPKSSQHSLLKQSQVISTGAVPMTQPLGGRLMLPPDANAFAVSASSLRSSIRHTAHSARRARMHLREPARRLASPDNRSCRAYPPRRATSPSSRSSTRMRSHRSCPPRRLECSSRGKRPPRSSPRRRPRRYPASRRVLLRPTACCVRSSQSRRRHRKTSRPISAGVKC